MTGSAADKMHVPWAVLAAGVAVAVGVAWSYAAVLIEFAGRWANEPDYIHGFLVIPFSLVLLWSRRERIINVDDTPTWWGLVPLGIWAGLRLLGAALTAPLVIALSLIPFFWGLALWAGGWRTLHWSWSAAAFLVFMIPLPAVVADWLSGPLREIGASWSVYIIQAMGIPATVEGTTIGLPTGNLGVADVCSGIRMLMLFFAVCTGAAMLLETRPWEKIVIFVSAIPIAIIANVARITVTAILHDLVGAELADRVFHDLAGWFMMPLAIVLLMGELALLRHILSTGSHPPTREASPTGTA